MADLTKQINAVSDLMLDYSNQIQVRHLLKKFEGSLGKKYRSNQEYCKLLIDPEDIDNAINIFKNQEFRVIEITKTVENFLEECKEFDTLYDTNFENPLTKIFHQNQKVVKPSVVPYQRIVIQNCHYPPGLENLATVQNFIVHPNHPNLLLIQDHLKNYY